MTTIDQFNQMIIDRNRKRIEATIVDMTIEKGDIFIDVNIGDYEKKDNECNYGGFWNWTILKIYKYDVDGNKIIIDRSQWDKQLTIAFGSHWEINISEQVDEFKS